MNIKEGQKSKGICYECEELVSTTLKPMDYTFKGHTYSDVLIWSCDKCNTAVGISHIVCQTLLNKGEQNETSD